MSEGDDKMKRCLACLVMAFAAVVLTFLSMLGVSGTKKDYIRYVEFNPTYQALKDTLNADIASQSESVKINWIDLLALLAAKNGGSFSNYTSKQTAALVEEIQNETTVSALAKDLKYFDYYREAYGAVLDGLVGTYTEYTQNENGVVEQTEKYGLKAYSPIAATFPYSHYDDFGASRTYGYAREHLGHDMMCAVGTPIIAVEDGIVEIMGWNEYGGWRIGIRSGNGRRYYYYAHLRQNRPYHCDLYEGKQVKAGEVIGYAGRTGYSKTENVNNIETPHLHFGLELIFDESQKECDNEIWVSLYALTQLLEEHKSSTIRVAETKEFYSLSQSLNLPKQEESSSQKSG